MTHILRTEPSESGARPTGAVVIVVSTDPEHARSMAELLSAEGYLVTAVPSYPDARDLLRSVSPDLVIADVQLDAFNGLQLAIYCEVHRPAVPVIVTHHSEDPGLEREAAKLRAIFIARPLADPEFVTKVRGLLAPHERRVRVRQWPRKRASEPVHAQVSAVPARVVDVSYGGLRLAFGEPQDIPDDFDVKLPDAGITVRAHRVWTTHSAVTAEIWCGAAINAIGDTPPIDWTQFVDSVS